MTIGNPAFCLALYLTGVHFRRELQHVCDMLGQKIKCRLIRTQEIGGVRLEVELYVRGCSYDVSSSYFSCESKVWSMLHQGSVGVSSE